MIDPRTVRGRLGIGYAITLLAALTGFAIVTLLLVDRTQRSALDAQLSTAVRTLVTIPDEEAGSIHLDAGDVAQFNRVTETRLDGAILDARGRVLADSSALPPPHTSNPNTLFVAGDLRVDAAPIERKGVVVGEVLAWHSLDDIGDVDRRLALAFAITIPSIALVAVLLGGAVAARGLRPLTAMADLASAIEANDLSARLGAAKGNDELARLCATFDKMLDRLQAAFERQRRFTSDASHELRAPLSVIRAEADLMIRRRREPAEYERALHSIAAHADELEALVRDLLAAARSESVAADGEIDLAVAAGATLDRLQPLATARAIELDRRFDRVIVRCDDAALQRALLCVVHNALTFSQTGGTVTVTVTRANGDARIAVTDEGPGFSPDALVHATERFWRDDHVRTERAGGAAAGSGLGLSIVESIVRASGGSLRLENRPRGGAMVTLSLPVSSANMK